MHILQLLSGDTEMGMTERVNAEELLSAILFGFTAPLK